MFRDLSAHFYFAVNQFASRPLRMFFMLTAISAFLNIGVTLMFQSNIQISKLVSDELVYYQLAQDIINGSYEFQSYRVLGHPLILAIVQSVAGGNMVAEQIIITFIFSLTVPLTYLLVRKITANSMAALMAGLIVMFWPVYVIYAGSFFSETTALPIFLTFLIILPRGPRLTKSPDVRWWRWLAAGLMLGVCIHVRPMYLLFCPFSVLIIFLEEYRFKMALRSSIFLTCGVLITIIPWSFYVSNHEGEFVLLSTNGAETISGGLNPTLIKRGYAEIKAPDGRVTWIGPGKWLWVGQSGYLSKEELLLPRVERNRLLNQRAFKWIRQNPGDAAYLEAAKLLYMWGVYPFWNGWKQTLFGNVPTVLILLLGVFSGWRLREQWRSLARFWFLPVFVSLVALISWGSWRFRQPGDLGLIVLVALLLHDWWTHTIHGAQSGESSGPKIST